MMQLSKSLSAIKFMSLLLTRCVLQYFRNEVPGAAGLPVRLVCAVKIVPLDEGQSVKEVWVAEMSLLVVALGCTKILSWV